MMSLWPRCSGTHPGGMLCGLLVILAGCSGGPADPGLSRDAAPEPVAAAGRPAAAGGSRQGRPIPEVIARAKPFRMSAVAAERQPASRRPAAVVTGFGGPARPGLLERACDPDVDGIRATMRSYLEAFNRHDAAALAAHWSDAGENVDLDTGDTTSGREAVRDVFAALFDEDAGTAIDIDVKAIRPVGDDVAVVDGVSRISFTDAPESRSRFSAVMVRRDGAWVIDTVRESAVPREAAAARPLDELEWLVGQWEDVSEGVTASTHSFWSANRAFLVRSHVVTIDAAQERRPEPGDDRIPGLLPAAAAGRREITEIVGWDPDRGLIRSWYFTSDGRVAEGTWSRQGDVWTVRLEGSGLGAAADATCTISRAGDDAVSIRCGSPAVEEILPLGYQFLRTARLTDPAQP